MVYGDFDIEIVTKMDSKRMAEVRNFLAEFALTFDDDVEYTIVLRAAGVLVGTGSFAGEVLRNIAIHERMQSYGLAATIVSQLIQEQARRGRHHYFIFTKPSQVRLFKSIGFSEIARAEPYVALLETGIGSINTYCASIAKETVQLKDNRAALVVNCNPFTKGHQALIQRAAQENEAVIVFVVSEDRSLFPFLDRFTLVQAGVADLPNVVVVPAGKYLVSAATFPTYFTRDEDKVIAQTRLDSMLFATRIAPALRIKTRYVGDEPYDAVTNAYNQAILNILPQYGITVKVIERVQVNGEAVSASKVRELIKHDDWTGIKSLVPDSTYQYLVSADAENILEKIRISNSRH